MYIILINFVCLLIVKISFENYRSLPKYYQNDNDEEEEASGDESGEDWNG